MSQPEALAAYRHTQLGTAIVAASAVAIVLATVVVASLSNQTLQAAPGMVAGLYGVIGLGLALFWRMRVEVDEEAIRLVLGVGLVRRTLALADVRRADAVRTRILWGYGVHWTPSGWLYNVAGRKAVRVELAAERPVIIGTDEPEALKSAIDARLAARLGRPN